MVSDADPHRILGVPPGASQAEVKRAYRRLAKAWHPDTAGDAATPRFLAIQAAYERLTGESVSEGSRGGRTSEPWRADPDRARASRDAWGGRARRTGATGAASGGSGATDTSGGAAGRSTRDGGAAPGSGPARDGGAAPGSGPPRDAGARQSSRRRPHRPPNRATPGSTTYDGADHEPFDPEWSGASWYGTTSGTYWTINPKEYADPRKHGPEYQARGRRQSASGGADPDDATGDAEPRVEWAGAAHASADTTATGAAAGRWDEADLREAAADAQSAAPAPPPKGVGGMRSARPAPFDRPERSRMSFPPPPRGWPSRIAFAAIAWPPLALGAAWLVGELSGCGRYAAACAEPLGITGMIGIVQLAILVVLLLLPSVAAISAFGTIAMLGAAIPAAMFLSATGGTTERDAAGAALGVLLAAAYLAGIAFAVVRRSRTIRA